MLFGWWQDRGTFDVERDDWRAREAQFLTERDADQSMLDLVLANGSVPMRTLERMVGNWEGVAAD